MNGHDSVLVTAIATSKRPPFFYAAPPWLASGPDYQHQHQHHHQETGDFNVVDTTSLQPICFKQGARPIAFVVYVRSMHLLNCPVDLWMGYGTGQ